MQPGTCKHFNGSYHNKVCLAGVCYEDVTPEPKRLMGKMLRLPCHSRPFGQTPSKLQLEEHAKRGTCAKYEEPTQADIDQHEREMQEATDRMMKATGVIREVKREHAGKSWAGIKTCPVCGGTLHMSHSSYNGHVHGKCETKDCLNWME